MGLFFIQKIQIKFFLMVKVVFLYFVCLLREVFGDGEIAWR